jgi:hypothetical protein
MRLSATITTSPDDKTQAPAKTEGAKGKLGTQTAAPTHGQTIGRNIANFFKGIGKAFVSLHNRVQAHTAERKLAANTKSAEKAASHLVKAAGKDDPDIRMGLLMPGLLAKAAKLDPADPVGKAVELLTKAHGKLPFNERATFGTTQWAAMESKINKVIDITTDRNKAVTQQIHRSNPGVGIHVTNSSDVSNLKASVKSLLTALQGQTDKDAVMYAQNAKAANVQSPIDAALKSLKSATAFSGQLDAMEDALDGYFQLPSTTPGTVLRGNSAMTTAIKEFIVSTLPNSKGDMAELLDEELQAADCVKLPSDIISGGKFIEPNMTPKQFQVIRGVADNLMQEIIGGTDPENIRDAANRLPNTTVQLLQAIDRKITEQFPDDEGIAINAFVGTMFLRFQGSDIATYANLPKEGRTPAEQAVGRLATGMMQSAFNRAADGRPDAKIDARFTPENADAYRDFVADYADAVKTFRLAVMDRETY